METTSEPDSGPSIGPEASREALRAVRRGQWHAFRSGPKPAPAWRHALVAVSVAGYLVVSLEGGPLAGQLAMGVFLLCVGGYLWRSRRRRDVPRPWRGVPVELRRTLIRLQLTYAGAGLALGVALTVAHRLMTPGTPRTVLEAVAAAVGMFAITWLCDRSTARTYRRWLAGQPA
jgi:hypothetical protein